MLALLPIATLFTPAFQAQVRDIFAGQEFPAPWVDPGFRKFVWIGSPNFGPRPEGPETVVDTVVIHDTAIPTLEETALAFFREASQVSAHFTIGKDGSIVQSVSTFDRAWHAGVSRDWRGRDNVNNFSIGVELVNLDDGRDPYPDAQIDALKSLIRSLTRLHPIQYLTSHEYIALPHGRKIDPNGFPWSRLADLGMQMNYEGVPPGVPLVETLLPDHGI
ncbi:MAG: N-acetylmuramoyl-L-alanine amidase [Fimbriimonadaceae bacterium]